MINDLTNLLDRAIEARSDLFDARHEAAFRLLNGFHEGFPDLAIDLYARTVVLHNYADKADTGAAAVGLATDLIRSRLPWISAIVLKTRNGLTDQMRRGDLIHGTAPDRKVREHGVWYAVDLTMNRDASLYLDTRNLRRWLIDQMSGQAVLNTFAYTGSLGVAAQAGGAARVLHLDLNRQFLNVAKTSYTLNGFAINKRDFLAADFWPAINRLKREEQRFDCVIIDPPFFAATDRGTVDLAQNATRVINKVRPLVNDGGRIVAINNALFLSGHDYYSALESLTHDGYVTIEELIPVAPDFIGYSTTRVGAFVTDPAPFNHSTKIAVLRVRRKHR